MACSFGVVPPAVVQRLQVAPAKLLETVRNSMRQQHLRSREGGRQPSSRRQRSARSGRQARKGQVTHPL